MKFRPLGDRVLLKRLQPVETTAGGLVLPVAAQHKSNQCVVVATGPGARTESGAIVEPSVRVSDHVCVAKHAGQDIKLDNEEFLLVRECDIMYVVEHEEDGNQ